MVIFIDVLLCNFSVARGSQPVVLPKFMNHLQVEIFIEDKKHSWQSFSGPIKGLSLGSMDSCYHFLDVSSSKDEYR